MRSLVNKKAQAFGFLPALIIGLIIAFVFAIVTLVVAYGGDEVFDAIKENPTIGASNRTVEKVNIVQSLMTGAFDQLVFFFMFAVVLGIIVMAIFSDFHPVFLIFLIIFIILMVIVAGLLANVNEEVTQNELLATKASEFPMTNWIMGSNLPIMIAVGGVIAILIILAKRGRVSSPV